MMSSLERLHAELEEQKIHYDARADGYTVLTGMGEWGNYLALLELPDGWIRACTWLPAKGAREIVEIDDLKQAIVERFHARAFIEFEAGQFQIFGFVDPTPEAAFYELARFSAICDELTPLLEEIGETGNWSENQINLALLPIQTLRM
jgi:hypothetical protein